MYEINKKILSKIWPPRDDRFFSSEILLQISYFNYGELKSNEKKYKHAPGLIFQKIPVFSSNYNESHSRARAGSRLAAQ